MSTKLKGASSLSAPTPRKLFSSSYQNGITDPYWPTEVPPNVDEDKYKRYRGAIDTQGFFTIITADLLTNSIADLSEILWRLTRFAYWEMSRKPSDRNMRALDPMKLPTTYRLTITIGFGSSLFLTEEGDDRFGIRHLKPSALKRMPSFPGDAKDFSPAQSASDVIVMVASDHPYVNSHIARRLSEPAEIRIDPHKFRAKHLEQGFARPDLREFLGFDDGTDNLRNWPNDDMDRLVYVKPEDNEQDWCVGGSYLVHRKITENLPVWEAFSEHEQQGAIGRVKKTGKPLAHAHERGDELVPVYPNPTDSNDGPLNAHIRKVQPRRPQPDIFGVPDLDRRFLRRPYSNYIGKIDGQGNIDAGLNFVAYMRSIREQFEYVTTMWQMNPNFPTAGTGIDALYAKGILSTVYGGYYFCPPAPVDRYDYIGSALIPKASRKKGRITLATDPKK